MLPVLRKHGLIFDPEQTNPEVAVLRALQDAGAAIERMQPDERHERVQVFLDEQGLLPDDPRARTFLVGVFIGAHWQREKLGALEECSGAETCSAALHLHGCFADTGGSCTEAAHGSGQA